MNTHRLFAPIAFLLSGCGMESINENPRIVTLREQAPELLYAARVVVEGADPETQAKLEAAIQEALTAANVFTGGVVTDDQAPADATIRVEVSMKPAGELPDSRTSISLAALSSVLWLAGGIPSWFISDRSFDPLLSVSLKAGPEGKESPELDRTTSPRASLNFFERASWPLYFVQFLLPPAVLPASESRTKQSLVDEFTEELQVWVADSVKLEWPLAQARGRIPMAQIHGEEIVLFSPGVAAGVWLDKKQMAPGELDFAFVRGSDKDKKQFVEPLHKSLTSLYYRALYQVPQERSPVRTEEELADVPSVDTLTVQYEVYHFPMNGHTRLEALIEGQRVSWTLRSPGGEVVASGN